MMRDDRMDMLRVDIYEEISYHLGIDDSDDGACDAKNRAALGVLRLIERELADTEQRAHEFAQSEHVRTWAALADQTARLEAARAWLATADPHPDRNGDHFADLRRILSGDVRALVASGGLLVSAAFVYGFTISSKLMAQIVRGEQ